MRRRHLSVFLLLLAGCPALQAPPPKTEPTARVEEDDEAGVQGISGSLRAFSKALAAKDFEEATKLHRKAERATQKASEKTRSHPDFEDLVDSVESARKRLEAAIEADRIERRNRAIDELIAAGTGVLGEATRLAAALDARPPTVDDVGALRELVAKLDTFRAQGNDFLSEARYHNHATARDAQAQQLAERLVAADWQVSTAAALNEPLRVAASAIAALQKATNDTERLAALRAAEGAFVQCANVASETASRAGAKPERPIETALGTSSFTDTRQACIERGAKARLEMDRLAWHNEVQAVVDGVNRALDEAKSAIETAAQLEANTKIAAELEGCESRLQPLLTRSGADVKRVYELRLGKGNVRELRAHCAKERARATGLRPTLEWRAKLAGLSELPLKLDVAIHKAQQTADPKARADQWSTVKIDLETCALKASELRSAREADARFVIASTWGKLTASALEKSCKDKRNTALQQVAAAERAVEIEKFAATCKADEIAVARREGIPSRIVAVAGGRIFFYDAGPGRPKAAAKEIGFDGQGKAYDFKAAWRDGMAKLAKEITDAVKPTRAAASGDAMLTATNNALPVLERCDRELEGTEKHPGFQAQVDFETPLGRHTAVEMQFVCKKERRNLEERLPLVRWQIQLETVRDRAQLSFEQLSKARSAPTAKERVELASAALGGLKECHERGGSITTMPGADAKLEVQSPFGRVTRAVLVDKCAAKQKEAEKQLAQHQAEKALEDFITACKADEREVAKREGMPTRVETLGTGRVFVYAPPKLGKAKMPERRFAFDAKGARTTEDALRPAPPAPAKPSDKATAPTDDKPEAKATTPNKDKKKTKKKPGAPTPAK